ncbi:helix-turn-helix domain-containing protein [Streptomyces chromofuscus]|uniref:Helix-turn-helix transcriptional regulator n=1 Tax=Streptomyces chromofuscus TaxID=42881 RepID=A0A7M2T6D9_STRCW|nr:helix-turn-helix domain-containing protein [Streptomyces chromofuscus]QOV43041.1 helix-turn-helix transcriptional regulator [Streptomyces chromofuscus]GGS93281.1 XRE family transcriptional regulator [Streptomyces chromofuscus]
MSEGVPTKQRTLAQKLDHLFVTIHPRDRGAYSYEEVASGIERSGGPTISASYIWSLRTGKKDNPTMKHLEALAGFFGVAPSYFFNDESAERIAAELSLLASMRDNRVRDVALRASGLSAETLETIKGFIERARTLEGLADDEASSR